MRYVILIFTLFITFGSKAQKIKYIETKTKNYGSYISQVQFIDTITGSIIKTINVEKDNPFYKELPKPDSIFYGVDKTMYFKYNNIALDNIIPKNNRTHYNRDANNSYVSIIKIPKIYVESKNKELCFMYGNAFLTSNMYNNYSLMFVEIFNKNGSKIFNKTFYSAGEAVLSSNNKFLNIAFSMDTEDGYLYNSYYEIYNISKQSLVYKDIISKTGHGGVINHNDTIMFFGKKNIIFDENKMELYNYERVNGKVINKGLIKKIGINPN